MHFQFWSPKTREKHSCVRDTAVQVQDLLARQSTRQGARASEAAPLLTKHVISALFWPGVSAPLAACLLLVVRLLLLSSARCAGGRMVVVDAAAAAGDGVAGAPSNEKGKDDYRNTLLPEKRKWSESDQEAASREWQELRERVAAASGTVANGAVSPVLVSFRGRVAARRDMGKALCFLSIHSLHRGTITTREASNWQVQEKGETLQVLVDLSRWEGQGDFFVEAGLLRIEAEIMIEGYCGKSEKHGDPLVYARWARMTRAKPHPVYIATLLEHCTQHRLPVGRVAESLEMDVAAVEALTRLEAKPMRKQAARISRVMQVLLRATLDNKEHRLEKRARMHANRALLTSVGNRAIMRRPRGRAPRKSRPNNNESSTTRRRCGPNFPSSISGDATNWRARGARAGCRCKCRCQR